MIKLKYILLLILLTTLYLKAEEPIEIPVLKNAPVIDGKLDEEVWQKARTFVNFLSFKPDYGKEGSEKTIMYIFSDNKNFYFAAKCYSKNVNDIKASMTKRDGMFGDDWVAFCIDTFSDKQRGYAFLINPIGIQGDGTLNNDGNLDANLDMVWYSKGIIGKEYYTVEIQIPFKSIRFPLKKKIRMGLWLVRNIVKTSESLSYPPLNPEKGSTLSQMQSIIVKDMKYDRVIEILPAFTNSRSQSHSNGKWEEINKESDISLTGKISITPSLTLDATYNPDFSQVEADAGHVDINLRYAIYYQEKRPFFLEGMDVFKFAGNTEEAPLYSIVHTRNIIDPVFGLKLSGNLGLKNNIAIIYAKDKLIQNLEQSENTYSNFGIMRFKHSVNNDNYYGGFITTNESDNNYNRIAGVDGRLRLSKISTAEFHFLKSLTKDNSKDTSKFGHALGLRYNLNTKKIIIDIGLQDISEDFQINTGFLTRAGLTRVGGFAMYRFYPKSKFFQRIEPFYWSFHILDKDSNMLESFNLFTLRTLMPRSSQFRLDIILANEVFAGKRFKTSGIGFQLSSQISKQLFFYLFYRNKGAIFYDINNPFAGRSNRASLSLNYQPFEKINNSISLTYSDFIRSTDNNKEYDYTIIRNHTTFQLNKYLFFRGIIEYNFFRKRLQLNFLTSFTYIPGTVMHIGYGSTLKKQRWDENNYVAYNKFMEYHRAFFFKVSYLWRL